MKTSVIVLAAVVFSVGCGGYKGNTDVISGGIPQTLTLDPSPVKAMSSETKSKIESFFTDPSQNSALISEVTNLLNTSSSEAGVSSPELRPCDMNRPGSQDSNSGSAVVGAKFYSSVTRSIKGSYCPVEASASQSTTATLTEITDKSNGYFKADITYNYDSNIYLKKESATQTAQMNATGKLVRREGFMGTYASGPCSATEKKSGHEVNTKGFVTLLLRQESSKQLAAFTFKGTLNIDQQEYSLDMILGTDGTSRVLIDGNELSSLASQSLLAILRTKSKM